MVDVTVVADGVQLVVDVLERSCAPHHGHVARYQMAVMMLMIMMFAAAVDEKSMKNVGVAAATVVTFVASVVVIPEVVVVVVVVGKHLAMDSSATMSNHRGFRGLRSCSRTMNDDDG